MGGQVPGRQFPLSPSTFCAWPRVGVTGGGEPSPVVGVDLHLRRCPGGRGWSGVLTRWASPPVITARRGPLGQRPWAGDLGEP